jgi:3-(3-hydroxy-phenyl)propionate hydroxylase
MTFDVVIVGLGPVGATIANLLGTYGVRTLVVERDTSINRAPRAIALDNEALRVLQLAGLADGAVDTIAIPYVQMRSPLLGNYACANTTGQIDGHPKLVTFFQPQLEEALRARLAARSTVEVRTGVELRRLDASDDSVRLVLRSGSEEQEVEADYVIGCDGAGSLVRKTIGLDFQGRTWDEDWLVVDVHGAPEPIDHIEFWCDPARPAPHMPAPGGRQRWEFKLRPGETRAQMEHPAVVHELLRPWTHGAPVELERVAVYRFHARIADRFSVGRVFLAGDAAHLTPPFAGQGLVSGLRDAANLAWKLAAVVHRIASPSILDSYTIERRPHAAATINMARLMGRLVMPSNRAQALAVHGLARLLELFPPTRALFGELEIKPVNGAREGLCHRRKGDRLEPGRAFGQGPVALAGDVRPSDDVLGDGFCLVGFGVDPTSHLDGVARARWRAIGGRIVQILHRGQRVDSASTAECAEDFTGRFLASSRALGRVAVVRPDRMVMCEAPVGDSVELVDETLALLAVPAATLAQRTHGAWPLRAEETI